jgi:S-adenosylhomocysteine hydrolase
MDISFAKRRCAVHRKNHSQIENRVYAVPEDLDKQVARIEFNWG